MNSFTEYFHTDWEAMTTHDWIGTILTVVVFLLMVGLWVYVLNPRNRDKLESQRHIPMEEDRIESEKEHGR